MRRFKNCHLARMSDGHYCIIRDLGPVKGGKGLKHHEVVVDFTWRAFTGFMLLRRRREPPRRSRPKEVPHAPAGKKLNPEVLAASDQSDGNPWKVRDSHQTVLAPE
jgi:hypothetical protein